MYKGVKFKLLKAALPFVRRNARKSFIKSRSTILFFPNYNKINKRTLFSYFIINSLDTAVKK